MRNDSADAVDPQFDVPQVDTDELLADAEALAAIDASWRDEAERTGVMQPKHLMSPITVDGDWGHDSAATHGEFAADDEDPHWDDEEMTVALDFDRLAPWATPGSTEGVPEDSSDIRWDTAPTEKLEPFDRGPLAAFAEENRSRHVGFQSSGSEPTAPARIPSLRASRSSSGVREILRKREPTPIEPSTPKWEDRKPRATARAPRPANEAVRSTGEFLRGSLVSRPMGDAPPAEPEPAVYALHPQPPAAARTTRKLRPVPEHLRAPAPPPRPLPQPVHAAVPSRQFAPQASFPPGPGAVAARPAHRTGPFAPVAPVSLPPMQPAAVDLSDLDVSFRPKRGLGLLWLAIAAAAAVAVVLGIRISLQPQPIPIASAPPPPAAPPEDTGFSVTTRPAGAQVYVDGKATGLITPARVRHLSPGLHSVELKLPGHFDTSLPASLEEGKTLQLEDVELRPLTAAADPAAAEPEAAPQVGSARAERAARRAARRARRQAQAAQASIDVYEGQSEPMATTAEPALESAPAPAPAEEAQGEGVLQINSRPWARVLIDDVFRGNTPQRSLRLPAGSHVVRLVNEPMKMSKTFTVEIREGETLKRVEILEEDPATQSSEPAALREDPSL